MFFGKAITGLLQIVREAITSKKELENERRRLRENLNDYRSTKVENTRLLKENSQLVNEMLILEGKQSQYDTDIAYLLNLTKRTQALQKRKVANGR
jgi:cell shape-determining protein MreC